MNGNGQLNIGSREVIIGSFFTLMLAGLVMIYTNTAVSSGLNPIENPIVIRQLAWIGVSLIAAVVFSLVDYHFLAKFDRVILIVAIIGLAAVLKLGAAINGAHRWFQFGPVNLQISELAKIAMVLYIAAYAQRKQAQIRDFFGGFVPVLAVIGVMCGLIVIEPDFGTAALILAVVTTMLISAGVKWSHLALLAAIGIPAMAIMFFTQSYRLQRFLVFLDPWSDPKGAGYHITQSLIALGSGGLTGMGPGQGLQKLGFLPEAETDFVFAVFGQETGFLGCVILLSVFVALFYSGIQIARRAPDRLGALIALGISCIIGYQMLINVAVATSAMPTKGISLPFVSLGGSALLALSSGIGMLINVARHCPNELGSRVLGATRKEAVA